MNEKQLETTLELATEALLEEREYAKKLALGNVELAETLHAIVAERKVEAGRPIVINNAGAEVDHARPRSEYQKIIDEIRAALDCPPNVTVTDHAREVIRGRESLKAHRDTIDEAAKRAGRHKGETVGELIARLKGNIDTLRAEAEPHDKPSGVAHVGLLRQAEADLAASRKGYKAVAASALSVLSTCEWAGGTATDTDGWCPVCSGSNGHHADDCLLDAVIGVLRKEAPQP